MWELYRFKEIFTEYQTVVNINLSGVLISIQISFLNILLNKNMDYKRILSNKYILFRGTLICKKKNYENMHGNDKNQIQNQWLSLWGRENYDRGIYVDGLFFKLSVHIQLCIILISIYCIFESWIYVVFKKEITQVLFLVSYGKMLKFINKEMNMKKTTMKNLRYTTVLLEILGLKKKQKLRLQSFWK